MRDSSEHADIDIHPVVAHRGFAADYPENTLLALRKAAEAGAGYIEIDVQLSADGVTFVLHDETFERTGGPEKSVLETPAMEVSRVSAGYPARFGNQFVGEKVPTLEAAVEELRPWAKLLLFVEIKQHSVFRFGAETTVAAVLKAITARSAPSVIISFVPEVIEQVRRQSSLPCGWVLPEWSSAARGWAESAQPEYLFCDIKRLPPEPELLWPGNWQWVAYEVTEPDHARQLLQRGIHLIESMHLVRMLRSIVS